MAKKLFARPEEKIQWSQQGLEELKNEIRLLASSARSRGLKPPRILFIGETGTGKSSFISSIVSALSGKIIYTSTVGERQGEEVNTSKRFLEHRVFEKEDGETENPLNFILCDSRGIAKKRQQGAALEEIERLIEGKMRHGDLIDDDSGRTVSGKAVDTRTPQPPSGVVFVQKANELGDKDPDVWDKLSHAYHLVTEKGLPSCVVLTHIDKVKEKMEDRLHLALTSNKIQARVRAISQQFGINENRIFVVKNYVHERRTHTRHDILILRAFLGILVDVEQFQRDSSYRRSSQTEFQLSYPELRLENLKIHTRDSGSSGYDSLSSMDRSSIVTSTDRSSTVSSARSDGLDHLKSGYQGPRNWDNPRVDMSDGYQEPRNWDNPRVDMPAGRVRQSLRRTPVGSSTSPTSAQTHDFAGQRNAPIRKSKTSEQTERSGCHDYTWTQSYSEDAERSDEKDYSFTDVDDDEGFESMGSPPTLSVPECVNIALNETASFVYPEKYQEDAKLRGAKPLHRKRVLQLEGSATDTEGSKGLQQQLQKDFVKNDLYTGLFQQLQDWCTADTGSVWISDTLHNDFGLPIDQHLPNSVTIQIFFLAPNYPTFLLTLFDPEKVLRNVDITSEEEAQKLTEQETANVKVFTKRMSKLLTSALFNFCSCDFLLLPCCIQYKEFEAQALTDILDQQRSSSRLYFGGSSHVSKSAYWKLKAAATAVAGVSYVPRLLDQRKTKPNEEVLVLLDCHWRGVVSLLIEQLTRNEHVKRTLTMSCSDVPRIKAVVAVVEAARRLSFSEEVVIITGDEDVHQCCGMLKQKMKNNTGIEPRLTVIEPMARPQWEVKCQTASYIIVINCSSLNVPDYPDVVVLHVDNLQVSDICYV